MDQRKDANPGSPRAVYPTRVVIECSKLPNWKALSRTLPAGFQVMHRSGTIKDMLAECQRIVPCVLIVSRKSLEELDVNDFRGSVGLGGSVRVLVLDSHKSPGLGEKFLSIGCMGYLPSDVSRSALKRAVRAIASGDVWADRKIISEAMKKLILKQIAQGLTVRETDILRLIVSGLMNREIADRLCITHETVRWHIRALYSKLGVQDRFSAIVYGRRLLDSLSNAPPGDIPHIRGAQASGDALRKGARPEAGRKEAVWDSSVIS